jgi:molybdenum cofactor guanylyltransferase
MAMAAAPEEDGQLRPQPVFCLMGVQLLESLVAFTQAGGRKIDHWTAQHRTVIVPFDIRGRCPAGLLQRQHPGRIARAGTALNRHGPS